MLKNEPLDAKIGVDTAENEPPKGSKKYMLERTPLVVLEMILKPDHLVPRGLHVSLCVCELISSALCRIADTCSKTKRNLHSLTISAEPAVKLHADCPAGLYRSSTRRGSGAFPARSEAGAERKISVSSTPAAAYVSAGPLHGCG